ncbi:hypothetical protein CKO51_16695 [Rhodopirellula sp. SM50]|nr:hypothetical protein CKO51_16695 [Rhodopirellula sp. SM50]
MLPPHRSVCDFHSFQGSALERFWWCGSATRGSRAGGGSLQYSVFPGGALYAVNDFLAVGREPSGVLAKMRKPNAIYFDAKRGVFVSGRARALRGCELLVYISTHLRF